MPRRPCTPNPEPDLKYGAHVFVWFDRYGDNDLAGLLQKAQGLGLAFLEVSVGDDMHFDAELLGRRASSLGIELVISPGGLWPMECDISLADKRDRERGLAWHKRALDGAGACGALAYAGAIYGHPGRVGPRPPSQAEKECIADGLHELAEYGAERNVLVALEPMSHFRTHVANEPRQLNELIRLADHKNIRIQLDTYHLATEVGSYAEAIGEAMPRLWSVHACESNRGVPGTGILPWDEILGGLKAHRWDGHVAFESYNSSVRRGEFAFSRGMFHNVCPDGDEFVRAALAFISAARPHV